MKIYSASEAIWPALLRTYSYALRPVLVRSFKPELFLKLAAAATLCEGMVVSFKFIVPHTFPLDVDGARAKSLLVTPEFAPVTILGATALVLLGIYGLYLITQLRFAFFHSLIHRTYELRKAAKIYSVEAERFFTASALAWLTFMVLGVLAIVLFIVAGYTLITVRTPEGKLDPGNFLVLFLPCTVVTLTLLLAAFAAHVVLNDFVLPHMAIESSSFQKAWAETRTRILANREAFFSFFILRLALPIFIGLLLAFLAWIAGLLVFGVLDMSAAGFEAMLDGAGGLRAFVLAVVNTLFFVLGLGVGCVLAAAFSGPVAVFTRCYAFYFYGGYYRPLGNLLEPPAAAPEPAEWQGTGQWKRQTVAPLPNAGCTLSAAVPTPPSRLAESSNNEFLPD